MQTIKLNEKQISQLIKEKKINVDKNKSIEIYEDELVYNINGDISYIKELNLEVEEPQKDKSEFLRNLICSHFNIEPNLIFCVSCEPLDSEFKIRFTPDKEVAIIICPITEAIKNTEVFYEEKLQKDFSTEQQIGLYRRLGKSCYFFRLDID